MTKQTFLCVSALAFLGACATPYQENGFMGGVSVTPLNESVYEIRAKGNGYTSASRSKDHALLKSAELCTQNGFTHFIPISQEQSTKKQTISNNTYQTSCFGYSCTTTGGGSTTFSKPRSNMTIKLFGANDEIPTTAYSCSVIYNSLAPKYIKEDDL